MNNSKTVLLVDDEVGFRENVAERFEARGFRVLQAGEGKAALELFRQNVVDTTVVDIQMAGMDGLTLLGRLKEVDPQAEVVMVTGQGSIEQAVEAMRRGAYHFVTKPVKLKELEITVRRAMEKTLLARQNFLFREQLRRGRGEPAKIIAHSPAMLKIVEQARQIAQTESTVLIDGETGTGKGVVAELIHRGGARCDHELTVVNCGALSDTLLDAELFGHERGAFTGATEARAGMIEVADGGSLFLDEIGDISPAAQARLLRFLEQRVFRRVGSAREQAVDVRILVATHKDLTKLVEQGHFRQDLYHRLLVFHLHIPPLRDRPQDIIPLAEHFISLRSGHGCPPWKLSTAAREALLNHPWPGNVRELSHSMERACFAARFADAEELSPTHLGLAGALGAADTLVTLQESQERHVLRVLDRMGGNRQKASEILGVSERHLYRLLQQYKKTSQEGQGL